MKLVFFALALALAPLPAHAESAFDRASAAEAAWEQCVTAAAQRMGGRAEAQTVADAAFARCEAEEQDFRHRLRKWSRGPLGLGGGASGEEIDRQIDVQRQRIRRAALARLLDP